MYKFSLALILSSILISPVFAQQRSGTPEEQKACTRDVERFCRKIMDQGDFVVLACLQQNRAKLTAACAQVLTNHGQ
jgi:hypothetical protein